MNHKKINKFNKIQIIIISQIVILQQKLQKIPNKSDFERL